MAAPSNGPCDPWIDADDVFDCGPCASLAAEDAVLAAQVAEAASRMLFLRTYRRYPGECETTVRPCRRCSRWAQPSWLRATWDPSWGLCGCGATSPGKCACGPISQIHLGYEPIIAITTVKVDGQILVAGTDYRLDDFRTLTRIDGEPWPTCQDLSLADTEIGTFSVAFTWGRAVPQEGILAAKALACELYQACKGAECRLPSRVRAVVRQGVEMLFHDPIELLSAGLTGIPEIDLFCQMEDFALTHQGTVVVTPDMYPASRRTST